MILKLYFIFVYAHTTTKKKINDRMWHITTEINYNLMGFHFAYGFFNFLVSNSCALFVEWIYNSLYVCMYIIGLAQKIKQWGVSNRTSNWYKSNRLGKHMLIEK